MIEQAKPVASRVRPAAAFNAEFAMMLFVMKAIVSALFNRF
jgi:hypothetical protein